jgi:hypothetical protein
MIHLNDFAGTVIFLICKTHTNVWVKRKKQGKTET